MDSWILSGYTETYALTFRHPAVARFVDTEGILIAVIQQVGVKICLRPRYEVYNRLFGSNHFMLVRRTVALLLEMSRALLTNRSRFEPKPYLTFRP